MDSSPDPSRAAPARYGYFVVQVRAERGSDGLEVSGVLENLGSGEKQNFRGAAALAALLESWGMGPRSGH